MSIINATVAGGTRRMLQDVLAWHNARSHDITRVNAMVASGLVPKDAEGNLKIPGDVLDGLWRPFPGSPPSTVNITSVGDASPAPATPASVPTPASPAANSTAPSTPKILALPWAKIAAIAAGLVGGAGGLSGLGYWLGGAADNSPAPVPPAVSTPAPNFSVGQTQYELRIGKRRPPPIATATPGSQ